MPFSPGDTVHVAALGKGVVREARNGDRYLVEVKGRAVLTTGDQLSIRDDGKARVRTPAPQAAPPEAKASRSGARVSSPARSSPARSSPAHSSPHTFSPPLELDLHGKTVAEAVEEAIAFLDRALRAGNAEVHLIHGRSSGKIKAAIHAQLRGMAPVRSFRVDPRNPGVTIVEL